MTAPQINLTEIVPLKYKTWITLFGTLLAFVGPFILQASTSLPSGVALAVGLFFAAMTTLGVYKAPYKPEGTTLAPDTQEVAEAAVNPSAVTLPSPGQIAYPDPGTGLAAPTTSAPSGGYTRPWKRPGR